MSWFFGHEACGILVPQPEMEPAPPVPSHGRGLWPRDVLKKVSRGLSRVEAGNPGLPRLVQVTSGGFSWWL